MISAVSVMGYDSYYTAIEALKAAGSTEGAAVMAALPSVTLDGVSGHIAFDETDNVLKRYDKKRGDYFNVNTRQNWSSMQTYDICLNSSALGIEGCARTICDMVRASENK